MPLRRHSTIRIREYGKAEPTVLGKSLSGVFGRVGADRNDFCIQFPEVVEIFFQSHKLGDAMAAAVPEIENHDHGPIGTEVGKGLASLLIVGEREVGNGLLQQSVSL